MAKGQMRSNKEKKKPKQNKPPKNAQAPSSFAAQVQKGKPGAGQQGKK